jgi:hypothetical protein
VGRPQHGDRARSSLPRPRLRDPDADPIKASGRSDGYRLDYLLEGPPGAVAIQRVETRIEYLAGERVVLRYEGAYAEWFRWGGDPHTDVHGFGLREDGWTPGDLRRLARELKFNLPLWQSGSTRIRCEKTFSLGLGRVAGERNLLSPSAAGGFGYLAAGPQGPPRATLALDLGEPEPLRLGGATPGGQPPVGEGTFTEAEGWHVRESFEHVLATRSNAFDPGGGYEPCHFPEAPL